MTQHPLILVVEDNPIQQRIVELFSAKCGFQCRFASCWSELANILSAESLDSFAMVLMDWHLRTNTTGLDCTRQLRLMEADSSRRIPIIGMTANAMDGARESCIASGMDDVLTKPFVFKDFKGVIDSWGSPESGFGKFASA